MNNQDQQIIAGARFLFKDKPYEVVVKTVTKFDGVWIPCVVYKTLYSQGADRPIGRVYVRNERDDEWGQFVQAILEWWDKKLDIADLIKQPKP